MFKRQDRAKGVIKVSEEKSQNVQNAVVPAPDVGACYGHGWHQLWKYFLELLLISVIAFVIGIPSGMGGWAKDIAVLGGFLGFVSFVYTLLVVNPVDYGVSFAFLKAARRDKLEINDMFEASKNYWNAVLANLLVGVIVVIGLFLLIVPGIIFYCKLIFTRYLVVDRKMGVIEAVSESWRMTRGHTGEVFLIALIAIPLYIAGLICFVVGVIVAIMWVKLAFASLYYSVSNSRQETS
jgi:uncharacterized membrane protein